MDHRSGFGKVLIISPPAEAKQDQPPERIRQLSQSLDQIGCESHIWVGSSASGLKDVITEFQPDLAWSSVYRIVDTRGDIHNCHQYLNEIGLPWVGSDPFTLQLVLAKDKLKQQWRENGVSTPDWCVVHRADDFLPDVRWNKYPAIIKPSEEGNSRGLSQESIVADDKSAISYIASALPKFKSLLIEHYLGDDPDLHEYTVAIIGNGPTRLYMPAEIILNSKSGKRIITTADKDQHHTRAIPVDEENMNTQIKNFARQAVEVAGVSDYARLDVLYSYGEFYAIEINGQPMLPDLWFDTCAKSAGLDRLEYIRSILKSSQSRWQTSVFPLKEHILGNLGSLED